MRALDNLVGSGKVRYIGFSNVPAWVAAQPGIVVTTIGARKPEHLERNLDELTLTKEHIVRLSDVSQPELGYPTNLCGELRTTTSPARRLTARRSLLR